MQNINPHTFICVPALDERLPFTVKYSSTCLSFVGWLWSMKGPTCYMWATFRWHYIHHIRPAFKLQNCLGV